MQNNHKPVHGDSLWYATKVWATGVIVLPILMSIFFLFSQPQNGVMGPISIVVLTLMIGGICSIPSWLLFFWATHIVRQHPWDDAKRRTVLAIVAILLTLLPFLLLSGVESFSASFLIALAYSLLICLGVFGYSFEENNTQIPLPDDAIYEISD